MPARGPWPNNARMSESSSGRITLRGLILARWVLLAVLSGLLALELGVPADSAMDWRPGATLAASYIATLAVWSLANLVELYLWRRREPPRLVAGVHLLLDTLFITALLAQSGGAANPFTMLYVVPLTLAIVVSPRWTWAVATASLAGFATLFLFDQGGGGEHAGHHSGHFGAHLRGMWLAYGITGALVTYAVHSIATRLNRERLELGALRERALEDRHLAQVGSLAAGAAHELGTPLATMNVLAGDLSRMSAGELADASDTLRSELARCKRILSRMAAPEPRAASGADVESWQLSQLADDLADSEATVTIDDPGGDAIQIPRGAVSQLVRELVTNARTAGGADVAVRIRIARTGSEAVIEVEDDGPGMAPDVLAAAFDPFFSTKPEGAGQGLGLYLARAQARLLGGTIDLESALSAGTRAVLRFPLWPGEVAS